MPRNQDGPDRAEEIGLPSLRPVRSSSINAAGYDSEHARLMIEYAGGARYVYYGVPASAYRELLAAESTGTYVNRVIKPRYPAEPLEP